MPRRTRPWARGGAAAAVLTAAVSAFADADETEIRLKTAGVEDALRARIHAAIERGAKYLIARQSQDGAFREVGAGGGPAYFETGVTALCSLALAHSGGPAASDAARRGVSYLAPDDEHARPSAVTAVYSAGLTAMLFRSLRTRPATSARIVRNLAAELDDRTGWWNYGLGTPTEDLTGDIVNLSTTQYGALGLWAGGLASGGVPLGAWRRHHRALLASQTPEGSWSYFPRTAQGYPNGTFMGLANLVLARQAVAADLADDPILAGRSATALRRARTALDRDGRAALEASGIDYYGWYALEKACVFLDTDRTGGLIWYVAGAQRLLAEQGGNGGWGGSRSFQAGIGMRTTKIDGDVVSTSFALLFLLRASETFRPTTPRDVEAPSATTPGSAPVRPEPAGPAVPPPPPPVGLATAADAVDRLVAALKRRDAAKDALAAVATTRAGLRRLEPDPAPADADGAALLELEQRFLEASTAWRERAGRALTEAVASREPAVALAAAEALAYGPRAASDALRDRLEPMLRTRDDDELPRALVEAAFRSLAALGDPASLPWLATRVTAGRRPGDVRQARAALLALTTWDGSGVAERRAAAARIARYLLELERAAAAANPDDTASWIDAEHWRMLGPQALAALASLSRDPESDDPVLGPGGKPPLSVAEFAEWLDAARRSR